MTPEQFVYWLQGFNEIRDKNAVGLSENQWEIVREHLQTVFHKVTPDRGSLKLPDIITVPQQPYQPHPYISPNTTGTDPNGTFPKWNQPTVIC